MYSEGRLARLRDAFDYVCDVTDWRAPIHATITEDELDITIDAITYFTGTIPEVQYNGGGRYEVRSVGYRNGPCGP